MIFYPESLLFGCRTFLTLRMVRLDPAGSEILVPLACECHAIIVTHMSNFELRRNFADHVFQLFRILCLICHIAIHARIIKMLAEGINASVLTRMHAYRTFSSMQPSTQLIAYS